MLPLYVVVFLYFCDRINFLSVLTAKLTFASAVTEFTLANALAKPIVPVVVIGPPVKFSPVLTCVTVPLLVLIPVKNAPLPRMY